MSRGLHAFVMLVGALLGFTAVMDMDFHWHLRLGQLALEHGAWPAVEPFSHLPLPTAPDHQAWLSDTLMAALHRYVGIGGLRLAAAALGALGASAAFRLGARRGGNPLAGLLVAAMWMALGDDRFRLRPDLITLALVPVMADLLDRESPGRTVRVFGLTALWTNLHPGAIFAPLLAGGRLIGPNPKAAVATFAASVVGLAIHPDGPSALLTYAADTTPLRPLIPEWRRLADFPMSDFPAAWAALAAVTFAALPTLAEFIRRRDGKGFVACRPGDFAVALLTTWTGVRFVFGLHLAAASLLAAWGSDRVRRFTKIVALASAAFLVVPVLHLAEEGRAVAAFGEDRLFGEASAGRGYPVAAATWIRTLGVSLNLAHPPAWGGYLASVLGPNCRTATDGRVTRFGAELAAEWSRVDDPTLLETVAKKYAVDMLVIPTAFLPNNAERFGWIPLYAGNDGAVVVLRDASPRREAVRVALGRR